MSICSRRIGRFVAAALALWLATSPVLSAASRHHPLGADSPQEVVARLEKAAKANDLPGIAACLTESDRIEITTAMLLASTMMVAFAQMGTSMAEDMAEGMSGQELSAEDKARMAKEKEATDKKIKGMEDKYRKILQKHKLPDFFAEGPGSEAGPEKAAEQLKKVDQVALLDDLMAFLTELDPEEADTAKKESPVDLPGKVTDYKVGATTATAKAGDETLEFVKDKGRWFLKAPEKKEEPGKATT
ncbi:MAG TPA: hypothetical protein VHN15_10840 [Thermoanaerobaculia bacterium]|nr:hypothetical protein [Thermoanaerobaculia bacterium]